jgi:hypothetical protein
MPTLILIRTYEHRMRSVMIRVACRAGQPAARQANFVVSDAASCHGATKIHANTTHLLARHEVHARAHEPRQFVTIWQFGVAEPDCTLH